MRRLRARQGSRATRKLGGPAGCSVASQAAAAARGQAAAACRQMLAASSWPPLSPLRRGGWIGKRVGSCSHCRFLGQKEIGGSSANARAPCACSGQNAGERSGGLGGKLTSAHCTHPRAQHHTCEASHSLVRPGTWTSRDSVLSTFMMISGLHAAPHNCHVSKCRLA